MGYSSLNLNNGFHDPTFCREVLYNNFVAQFIPNPRANHVVVTPNGQNWGVYINVQQFNKTMLGTGFADTGGLRIKCANNPNGPGLRYNGANASGYSSAYEIKDPGGFADPWPPHIAVCNALTNAATATWTTTIDPTFAVDPSIWSVVMENMLTDDDSYINKGADFMTYRNPTDGRTFLLQTDANETFTQSTWAINRNFTQTQKPFLSRVLAVPEVRQRYMAHYRRARQHLNWDFFGPRAAALRSLIETAVQNDPKKLYSFASFQTNFTSAVSLGGQPPFGGTVPGLQQFVTERTAFLNTSTELNASGPTISAVSASDTSPDPSDAVTITATVAPNGSAVTRVDLWYRPRPTTTYQRLQMTSAGNNQYTAPLPISAVAGQRVAYYVAAIATNTFSSASFFPDRTEWTPLRINYTFGSAGGMRITEWMYSGPSGEFIEFTNMSNAPVDMTDWSMDDDHAVAGAFSLSGFGVVQPGESVIVTEAAPAAFRTAWGLPETAKVIGSLGAVGVGGNNLARGDEINLYNSAGELTDRLTYGDQVLPGTIRTQNVSGQTCRESVGQDSVSGWVRSVVNDQYASRASTAGEIGSPGAYAAPSCFPCANPGVGTSPLAQNPCPGTDASFSIIATGTGPLTYRWQSEATSGSGDFTDLVEGEVSGLGTIAGVGTATLTLSNALAGGATSVRCVVTNGCGEATSGVATLSVRSVIACCPANFNHDEALDPDDLADFIGCYFQETASPGTCPVANFDSVGEADPDDLADFIAAYFGGCA